MSDTIKPCESDIKKKLKVDNPSRECTTDDDCKLADDETVKKCTCNVDGKSRCEIDEKDPGFNEWYWKRCNDGTATEADAIVHSN
jgi:hypothetical protein